MCVRCTFNASYCTINISVNFGGIVNDDSRDLGDDLTFGVTCYDYNTDFFSGEVCLNCADPSSCLTHNFGTIDLLNARLNYNSAFCNTSYIRSVALLNARLNYNFAFSDTGSRGDASLKGTRGSSSNGSSTNNQCRSIYFCCCNNGYNITFPVSRNIDDDRFVIVQITRTNDNSFSKTVYSR